MTMARPDKVKLGLLVPNRFRSKHSVSPNSFCRALRYSVRVLSLPPPIVITSEAVTVPAPPCGGDQENRAPQLGGENGAR